MLLSNTKVSKIYHHFAGAEVCLRGSQSWSEMLLEKRVSVERQFERGLNVARLCQEDLATNNCLSTVSNP